MLIKAHKKEARDPGAIQIDNNHRWWEFYLVRYAIGTVIGALCVYSLIERIGGNIKSKVLMIPPITEHHLNVLAQTCIDAASSACIASLQLHQDLYSLNLPQLLLLGVYGIVFCYIASAPGLVVHAVRRQIRNSLKNKMTIFILCIFISLFISILIINLFIDSQSITILTIGLGIVLIFAQLYLLTKEYLDSRNAFYFYARLHYSRTRQKISPESYRHLREHGNAFFIVILEILFLSASLSVFKLFGNHPFWPALLILWILPGAFVYFLGHRIEAEMIERTH